MEWIPTFEKQPLYAPLPGAINKHSPSTEQQGFEETVVIANISHPTCLKNLAQPVARNLLICIGVGLWTRRSPVHKGWRMESAKWAQRCFLGPVWEVRVHKKKEKTPRRLGLSGVVRK